MRIPAEAVFSQMLEVERWSSFRGWGPIPGIRSARFRRRTPEIVGSQIEVTNLDGSSHIEEIMTWEPGAAIVMRMSEFSPPLSVLATHTVERWGFEALAGRTRVTRSFELHPKGWIGRLALPLVAWLLGRAAARHLRVLDAE
jgi:hypothetical protein